MQNLIKQTQAYLSTIITILFVFIVLNAFRFIVPENKGTPTYQIESSIAWIKKSLFKILMPNTNTEQSNDGLILSKVLNSTSKENRVNTFDHTMLMTDTDGDLINDDLDLDDDNDGILDTDENPVMAIDFSTLNFTNQQISLNGTTIGVDGTLSFDAGGTNSGNSSGDIKLGDGGEFNSPDASTGDEYNLTFDRAVKVILSGAEVISGGFNDNSGGGAGDQWIFAASGGFMIDDPSGEISVTILHADTILVDPIGVQSVPGASSWSITTSQTVSALTMFADGDPASPINVKITELDTDGDNIADYLDLDSDNDGIYDAVEAGHGFAHTSGRVNGAVGTDGVPDVVQATSGVNSGAVDYTLADSESTPDGTADYLELDADGDGCNDVLEGGFTDGDDNGLLGSGTFGSGLTVDLNGVVTSGTDGYTTPGTDYTDFNTLTACGGVDGTVSITASILAGDNLSITVTDADLDTNPGSTQTVIVTVINTTNNESETVTLTETGNNTGIFTGTLATTLGTIAGTDNDGTLVVQPGEVAQVTYNDALTVNAGTANVTDNAIILEDTDSDGIADINDLDKDNDGILDSDEGLATQGTTTGEWASNDGVVGGIATANPTNTTYFSSVSDPATFGAGISASFAGPDDFPNDDQFATSSAMAIDGVASNTLSDAITNNDYIEFSLTTANTPNQIVVINSIQYSEYLDEGTTDIIGGGLSYGIAISDDNFSTSTLIGGGSVYGSIGSDTRTSGPATFLGVDFSSYEGDLIDYQLSPNSTYTIRMYLYGDGDRDNKVLVDDVGFKTKTYTDTDGDGIANLCDLDSDNDGLYDAIEAGHGFVHTNGAVNGTVGTDGIPDAVQATSGANSNVVDYTLADSESTPDGTADYLELDADGDGCNDVLEGTFTDGDSNGLLGSGTFGSGLTVDANGVVTSGTDGYTAPGTDYTNLNAQPVCVSLPLTLVSFDVRVQNSEVVLNWKTAQEINNNFFQIERSKEISEFTAIGIIDGAGNSNTIKAYTFTDPSPLQDLAYYRLKQIDFDGTFSYSAIKAIRLSQFIGNQIRISPNPVVDVLEIQNNTSYQLSAFIFDIYGHKIDNLSLNILDENQTLNLISLPSGVYYIRFSNGIIRKFVKQ